MDLILVGLLAVAFIFIIKTIYNLGVSLLGEPKISYVISEIMFIFILIEVVRLLILYLQFHRVAIDTMVEIAIVSVLREVILNGVLHTEPIVLGAASLLILVLMLLLRHGNLRYTGPELYTEYRPFFGKGQKPKPLDTEDIF